MILYVHLPTRARGSLISDRQSDAFSSFTASLSDSARRANQAFGLGILGSFIVPHTSLTTPIGPGTPKQYRILVYSIGSVISLWVLWKILGWLFFSADPEPILTGNSYTL
jgi:hypothetical protein